MLTRIDCALKMAVGLSLFLAFTGSRAFAGGDVVIGVLTRIEIGESSVAILIESKEESAFQFSSTSLEKYNLCSSILILFEQRIEITDSYIEKIESQWALNSATAGMSASLEFLATNGSDIETSSECSLYTHLSEDSFHFDQSRNLILSLGFPND